MSNRALLNRVLFVAVAALAGLPAHAAERPVADCDVAATQTQGALRQETHAMSGDREFVQDITRRAGQLIELVREATPGAKGYDATYTSGIAGTPFVKDGPQKYGVRILFYHYGCEHATGRIKLNNGDLKSVLEIAANYPPGGLNAEVYGGGYPGPGLFASVERMRIGDGVHNVYVTQTLMGRWKGFAAYGNSFLDEPASNTDPSPRGHVSVYIGRKNEEPFIPVTRRQYIPALLDALDAKHQEQLRTEEQARERNPTYRANIDTEYAQRKAWIEQQLNAPAAELDRPALLKGGTINTTGQHIGGGKLQFSGKLFSDEEIGSSAVLVANKAYWRMGEGKTAPQLLTLTFSYDRHDLGSGTLSRTLRDAFPLDKLQALLDR